MALTTKNYLDLTGLQAYDALIKNYIDTGDAKAIKTVLWDDTNEQINFYKKENATSEDTPDYSVSISSSDVQDLQTRVGMSETLNSYQSEDDLTSIMNILTGDAETTGSVAKIAADEADAAETAANDYTDDTIAGLDVDEFALATKDRTTNVVHISGIKEVDGKIQIGSNSAYDLDLAPVAATGDAADVAFTAGQGSTIAATNVNTAINELESDIKDTITAMDGTATIATATNGVVTLKSGVAQTSGEIANDSGSDITLAKVATTGTAADVAIVDSGSLITATDVEGALAELAQASAGGVASKTVYITETSGGTGDLYSKRYGVYQGATGSAASPVVTEKLCDIDIPKDMVVEEGVVVDVVFDNGHLYEGSTAGTDVTEEIKGAGGTATADDAGKYIKLTIANAISSHLWIKATDLVDIYTAAQGATEVQLAIDNNNVISASIVKIDGEKVVLPYYQQCYVGQPYNSEAEYFRWNGNVYVFATPTQEQYEADPTQYYLEQEQSVALAYKRLLSSNLAPNASIEGIVRNRILPDLATSSDVAVATYTAGTGGAADKITFTGSITEANGVIDEGTADSIELSNITTTQINALFA